MECYEGGNRRVLASAFPCATPAALFGSRAAQGLETAGNQTGGQPPRPPARHIHVCTRTRTRSYPNPYTRAHLRSYTSTHPNPAAPSLAFARGRGTHPWSTAPHLGPRRPLRPSAGPDSTPLGPPGRHFRTPTERRGSHCLTPPSAAGNSRCGCLIRNPHRRSPARLVYPSASPLAASVTGTKTERPRSLPRSSRQDGFLFPLPSGAPWAARRAERRGAERRGAKAPSGGG